MAEIRAFLRRQNGAELLLYPTAIGSEPVLECDSMPHWQRCMQGHAAANLVPVIAANRTGTETVTPDADNHTEIFPIMRDILNANLNLVQNPGYNK